MKNQRLETRLTFDHCKYIKKKIEYSVYQLFIEGMLSISIDASAIFEKKKKLKLTYALQNWLLMKPCC